jgi:membrane protein DedA with SNARE-associated domain/membrane-associated phospholipid phosphatase
VTNLVLNLLHWAAGHPQLAGFLVALIACLESLAFVGMVVPGAVLMLGAGALVGAGALDFWATMAWAIGGAVLGDGLSYWLGHHYKDHINKFRFVRSHPRLLARGVSFFKRHGGKSILLARFVGPVRPILPVVAGSLGMPPLRFYAFNIFSALLWAPAHLLPGMAFGASLALAGEVAGRLALGVGIAISLGWLGIWATRRVYGWVEPRAQGWASSLLRWVRSHPHLGGLIGDLLDPNRPVSRSLLLWLILLVAGAWLFFGVLEDVLSLDPLVYAGQSLYHLLQQLRTPVADRFMTILTETGDAAVALPVSIAVFAWLLWQRKWRDARYWLAALGFGVLAVFALKLALHMPRPADIYSGRFLRANDFSFPSGHTTLTTVIYAFLAVLSARSFAPGWRWLPYALAVLLIGAISFSRLYLGAHWLADVAAGLGLGSAWVALLAIARTRHGRAVSSIPGLPQVALLVFVVASGWHVYSKLDFDLARYAARVSVIQMKAQQWWTSGWRSLSAFRIDLQGEQKQPLNMQFAGDIQDLANLLGHDGWRRPQALTLRTAAYFLLPNPSISELPELPQFHDGRYDVLVLVKPGNWQGHPNEQLVLRLWPSGVDLRDPSLPLWVGTVAWQSVKRVPLLRFPHTAGGYGDAMAQLAAAIGNRLHAGVVQRRPYKQEGGIVWNGETLLVTARLGGSLSLTSRTDGPGLLFRPRHLREGGQKLAVAHTDSGQGHARPNHLPEESS